MTKIFITIPWFLPAFRAGGPIQSIANLVREYNEGVQYYIFCSNTDLNGGALENVATGKWVKYNEYTQVWYAHHKKISNNLVKQIEVLNPDILYIIGIYSWHFNIVPLIFCKVPVKILSVRGMLHPGALSQKKWKKKIYLQVFKLLEYHHKIAFHATDEREENYIRTCFGKAAVIHIAGNFPGSIGALPIAKKERGVLRLVSIGIVSPMKNILLVLEALSEIDSPIHYNIYGPVKDFEYWNNCTAKINTLPANINVAFHYEIDPSRVRDALSDAHVFILPSKSENFGHAIYEALSAARPVITSNGTPWNRLEESFAGMNVPVGDSSKLAQAIQFFTAMDELSLNRWSRGAIDYAVKAIDLKKIRKQYREMLQSATIAATAPA